MFSTFSVITQDVSSVGISPLINFSKVLILTLSVAWPEFLFSNEALLERRLIKYYFVKLLFSNEGALKLSPIKISWWDVAHHVTCFLAQCICAENP